MPYKDTLKQKKAQHESYLRNKKEIKNRWELRRERYRQWYADYLKDKGCENCSETSIACLEFHHINRIDKKYEISTMMRQCKPFKEILDEMTKCIVLCANCHRKLHNGAKWSWVAQRLEHLTDNQETEGLSPSPTTIY